MELLFLSLLLAVMTLPMYLVATALRSLSSFGLYMRFPEPFYSFFSCITIWTLYWSLLALFCYAVIFTIGYFRHHSVALAILRFDAKAIWYDFHTLPLADIFFPFMLTLLFVSPILILSGASIIVVVLLFNNFPLHRGAPCSCWPNVCS